MRAAVGLTDGLGLDGDRCIRVIPQQEPRSSSQLTAYPWSRDDLLYDLLPRWENQQKVGQTELLELRELEFNPLGITARNGARISTVKSVTSYLLDGVKATTDDLRGFSVLHHHGNDR